MAEPRYVRLETVASTNTYLCGIAGQCGHGTVVVTDCQTAGRGQRGNSWESENGKNLTFSMLLRPQGIDARSQFVVSQVVSVAIADVLKRYIGRNRTVAIKWPNDIYVDDYKIGGILIENSLMGNSINHSVIGIGLNVNQREFTSDAPNPVSLLIVINREVSLHLLLDEICRMILELMDACAGDEAVEALRVRYIDLLWRGVGEHRYRDCVTGDVFWACISAVEPNGLLHLRLRDSGEERVYAFKEVAAVL